jgi:hypothetical protein
MAALRDQ